MATKKPLVITLPKIPKTRQEAENEWDKTKGKKSYSGTPYNTNRDNSEVFQEGKNKGKITGKGAIEETMSPIDFIPALDATAITMKGIGMLANKLPAVLKTGAEESMRDILDLIYTKKIKNTTPLKNKLFDEINTTEGRKRLSEIGVDPNKFLEHIKNIPTISRSGNSTYSAYSHLNMDYPQLKTINKNAINGGNNIDVGFDVSDAAALDHEIGHSMQRKGVSKNSDLYNKITHSFAKPTYLDNDAEQLIKHFDRNYYNKETGEYLKRALNKHNAQEYFEKGEYDEITERLPFLRETKRMMQERGYINNIYSPIDKDVVSKFLKENPNARMSLMLEKTDEAHSTLASLLNKTPIVAGAILAANETKASNPDVIEIAKGLKHGQTMGEFNSLNKIDRQRTIDAFNLLHAKSNFTFDDIDFKSAKTESDSTNAISDYFNGRILGQNSNSLEGQGIMNTKQSKNFTKGFLSTLPKRKLGGKLPKYDNGNNFQWNSAGATPTAPQTQTYSIAPATSSFAPITAKDTMNTSMTKSDYSSYLKDNSGQVAMAGLYGLANASGAYKNTKGNSSDKSAAAINGAVDGAASVLTPWYAYAKTAATMGEDMVDKTTISDADGGNVRQVGKNETNMVLDNILDPTHETMIKSATKGDWKGLAFNVLTNGVYGKMAGIGKDKKDLKAYKERIAAEEAAAAEAKRIAEEKFRLEQQTNYSKGYNIVNPTTGRENAGIYKYGGGLPKLVTGGNLIPVSSDTQKVVGASHEQGGVPIANKAGQPVAEVEGGESITDEKVFTDRVEVSPGITFAMMNEALGKKKGKFETKLASSDFREKNTAKREIQKIDSDINQLFELQGQKVQALGLDNGNTQDMPKASFGADLGKYASLLQYPYNANIIAKTPKIPKPVDDVNYNQVTMPMKTDYNINSALLNNESNFRKLNKNLDENTSNSATARGNKLAAFSKVLSSNNDLYTLKENTQTDLINKSNTNNQSVINSNIVNKQTVDNTNITKLNTFNSANMLRDSDINKMKTDNFASLTKNIGDISNYDQEKKVDFQQKMTILVNQSNAEEITRLTGTSVMSDILNADKRNYDVVISKLKTLNDGGVALANFVKAHPR